MALDTLATYHVALLNLPTPVYVDSLKLYAGSSQLSYRSEALSHDISVFPDRNFKPCFHGGQTDYSIAPQHIYLEHVLWSNKFHNSKR